MFDDELDKTEWKCTETMQVVRSRRPFRPRESERERRNHANPNHRFVYRTRSVKNPNTSSDITSVARWMFKDPCAKTSAQNWSRAGPNPPSVQSDCTNQRNKFLYNQELSIGKNLGLRMSTQRRTWNYRQASRLDHSH